MSRVEHLESENMFVVPLEGERAHLKYHLLENGVIEYYSTFVPDSARGQGLAQILVDAGVAFAQSKNLKIKPTCWYVAKYLDKHSELHSLRV